MSAPLAARIGNARLILSKRAAPTFLWGVLWREDGERGYEKGDGRKKGRMEKEEEIRGVQQRAGGKKGMVKKEDGKGKRKNDM